MREMCCRGKRVDNGEWVEGFYVHLLDGKGRESHRIYTGYAETDCGNFYPDWYEVDPATVGRYTGLSGKNGKKIFEGDIVKTHYANVPKADFVEEVVFHNGKFCALYQKDTAKMWMPLAAGVPHHPKDKAAYMEWCEVIGNIHDNPELLKQEVQ